MRKSKIICTIGPASESSEVLSQLIAGGADVFRFNFKYNTADWHRGTIRRAKLAANKKGAEIRIMADIPDATCLSEAVKEADFLAVSYVKAGEDIKHIRRKLKSIKPDIQIIAKIEDGQAIRNLSEIIEAADGIMVARGDLGRDIPMEQLAFWQKEIIEVCRLTAKPVIVATEMLLSMKDNPRPTRAEATDVANAVFDGTDALMLSEETAVGVNPAKALEYMVRITEFCDGKETPKPINVKTTGLTEVLVEAAIGICSKKPGRGVKAMVVFSQSGQTVRRVVSYRPKVPIIAITNNSKIVKFLGLSWGVIAHYWEQGSGKFEIENPVFDELRNYAFLKKGDLILVIHGNNWMSQGSTSDISLKLV